MNLFVNGALNIFRSVTFAVRIGQTNKLRYDKTIHTATTVSLLPFCM